MTRRAVIAGNWKMNKTVGEAVELARELRNLLSMVRDVDLVVGPVFTALPAVCKTLEETRIGVAGQDVHTEVSGAYTGNISAEMLKDVGCSHVIVGHSERRQYHAETDALVHAKAAAGMRAGLVPILCIGERLEQREAGQTMQVIRQQVTGGLAGFSPAEIAGIILAYEPVWAIGTGKTATPEQAQEVHAFIRGLLRELAGADTAESVRILYGGSVKPTNVDDLMAKPDIDGALVGGAALKADSFVRIAKFAR